VYMCGMSRALPETMRSSQTASVEAHVYVLCPPGRRETLAAQLLGPEGTMWEWVIHSGSVLHIANDVATAAERCWPPTIRRACAASAIEINAIRFKRRRLTFGMNSSRPMTSFRLLKVSTSVGYSRLIGTIRAIFCSSAKPSTRNFLGGGLDSHRLRSAS
jgi:hypothetical protein